MRTRTTKKEFIKNIIEIDVDAFRGVNHYVVVSMYDVKKEDERGTYWDIEQEIIEDLEMTWEEIEKYGGVAVINKEFEECYNIKNA